MRLGRTRVKRHTRRISWDGFQKLREAAPEDPKPWFYAGLFSLATVEEARRFLANHSFTLSAIPSLSTELCPGSPTRPIGEAARDKSEENMPELQSPTYLVFYLLIEQKQQ